MGLLRDCENTDGSFAALTLTLLWDNSHSMTEPNHDEDDEECDDGAAQQGDHSDHHFHTDINLPALRMPKVNSLY